MPAGLNAPPAPFVPEQYQLAARLRRGRRRLREPRGPRRGRGSDPHRGPPPLFAFATPMPYVAAAEDARRGERLGPALLRQGLLLRGAHRRRDRGRHRPRPEQDLAAVDLAVLPSRRGVLRGARTTPPPSAGGGHRGSRCSSSAVCPVPELLAAERDWVRAAADALHAVSVRHRSLRQRDHRLRRARSRRDGVRTGEVRPGSWRSSGPTTRTTSSTSTRTSRPQRPDWDLPDAKSRLSRPGPRRYRRAPRRRGGGAMAPSRPSSRSTTTRSSRGRWRATCAPATAGLPRAARDVRRRGARDPRRPRPQGPPGRRWSSPTSGCRGMTGIEVLQRGAPAVAGLQAAAADGVRRHRRRDPRRSTTSRSTTT